MNDSDLRWSLRQLPKEATPGRDLWPDIAIRIAAQNVVPEKIWRIGWRPSWAMALASGLLALGLSWYWPQPGPDPQTQMLQRQVAAMVSEYDTALAQVPAEEVHPALGPGLQALDASVVQIRQALAREPRSRWLIERLQRTYALRLQLARHGIPG